MQYRYHLQVGKLRLSTGKALSLRPHTSQCQEERPDLGPSFQLHPVFSPPSLSPLGLFCSPDQGKLCFGIVFPKKFLLPCHWMTQSPESPEEAKGQDGVGGEKRWEGEEGQRRGSQLLP